MRRLLRTTDGYSLVEMLAVISISTVLLGVAIGLIHRSMNLASQFQEQDQLQQSLTRLLTDLRRDVHTASRLEIFQRAEHPSEVRLENGALGRIAYWLDGNTMRREVVQPDSQTQREFYRLSAGTEISLAKTTDPDRLRFTVSRNSRLKHAKARLLAHVEIELGRLSRLATVSRTRPKEDGQ